MGHLEFVRALKGWNLSAGRPNLPANNSSCTKPVRAVVCMKVCGHTKVMRGLPFKKLEAV